jgi:S-adenosylmethionine uptake transporter
VQSYFWGAFWSLSACVVSALNDSFFRMVSEKLSSNGLLSLFFRFAFSVIVLLPLLLRKKFRSQLSIRHMKVHMLRGGLFCLAMIPWCYGLIHLPLPLMTTISFTTPLFVIILAKVFLKEPIGWQRSWATALGFIGIIVSTMPTLATLNNSILVALAATGLFACLDIINKRLLVVEENKMSMMFFSSVWSAIFALPFGIFLWKTPSGMDWLIFLALGIGANGILFCILKAFEAYDISALQPLRYTEFLISCFLSFVFFQQVPSVSNLLGALFIIPATAYIAYYERYGHSFFKARNPKIA